MRAGQALVMLDYAALWASVDPGAGDGEAAENGQAAAESDAKLAASTLARYRQLEAEKSVSPQEMDEVSGRAQAARQRSDAPRTD